MATHFSIIVWRILWTEEPGLATVHTVAKSQTQLKRLSIHTCTHIHLHIQLYSPNSLEWVHLLQLKCWENTVFINMCKVCGRIHEAGG